MAAEDLTLSQNTEAEFNPPVIIVAENPEAYAKFAALFTKNGFQCDVHSELPYEMLDQPAPGAIFFVSFNLKSADAASLARRIEQQSRVCIVFAEHDDFDTAAKLSSAKMTQTQQFPYTEKNFLMAVQTIVKKRKVQHEKDKRKKHVLDSRKDHAEAALEFEPRDRHFESETPSVAGKTPVIIQKGLNARGPRTAHFSGQRFGRGYSEFAQARRSRSLSEMQTGLKSASFMVPPSAAPEVTSGLAMAGTGQSPGHAHVKGVNAENAQVTVSHRVPSEMKQAVGSTPQSSMKTAVQGSVKPAPSSHDQRDEVPSAALASEKARKALNDLLAMDETLHKTPSQGESAPAVGTLNVETPKKLHPALESVANEKTSIGRLQVPTWALIAASFLGILFCLFFLYQMMFNRPL